MQSVASPDTSTNAHTANTTPITIANSLELPRWFFVCLYRLLPKK
jgi:hypothetical protein